MLGCARVFVCDPWGIVELARVCRVRLTLNIVLFCFSAHESQEVQFFPAKRERERQREAER